MSVNYGCGPNDDWLGPPPEYDGWPRQAGENYPWGDSIAWPPGADLDD